MRDLIDRWGNTRMVVLTAMSASLYAAILIPFTVRPPDFSHLAKHWRLAPLPRSVDAAALACAVAVAVGHLPLWYYGYTAVPGA